MFKRKRRRKIIWIVLGIILLFAGLHITGVDAKAPEAIRVLAEKLGIVEVTPKVSTKLPADIQKAITEEAIKELKEGHDENHSDVLAEVDPEDIEIAKSSILPDSPLYFFKRTGRGIKEFFTFDPLIKTQLILKHNSWEMVETLSLLQKNLTEKNPIFKARQINIATRELEAIENRFNQVWDIFEKTSKTDKSKARAINRVAFNYTEKFFRQELILQELEDRLDASSMIKIENARAKRLGVFAKILTTYHPDPQVLSRELANSLSPETGIYYKELKTAELLQEVEDAIIDETQKTSLRLAQYILIERFEKKVLKLPTEKQEELLSTFVNRIYGSPMREFKTFTRVRKVFQSRELILFAELYKTKILTDFEKRVLDLSTTDLQNQLIEGWVKDPTDLRILEALELRSVGEKNPDPKLAGIVKSLKKLAFDRIREVYKDNPERLKDTLFYESATSYPDVLDIKVAIDINNVLEDSKVSADLEQKVVDAFVSHLPNNIGGTTVTHSSEVNNIIAEIRSEIPLSSLNQVFAAIEAEITIDSLDIPETQGEVINLVHELEENQSIEIITENLHVPINETISQADTSITEPSIEQIEERVEQLTEEIFLSPAGTISPVEETLPPSIQQEIEQIQETTTETPQVDLGLVETVVNTVEQIASPEITETPPPATVSVPSL